MRVILVGGGEVAYFLTRAFLSKGHPVSVVNRKRMECEHLAKNMKALVICGDGSDPNVLGDARAREAQLLIAVTPYDHINLVCCQTASMLFKIPRTLALVNDPDNYEIFKMLGIDHVFNETDLIVSMLEKQLEYSYLSHLLTYADGNVLVNEILMKEKMPGIGQRIDELPLPDGSRIIGILRGEKFLMPGGELAIESSDRLLLLSNPAELAPTLRIICGEEA